VPDCHDDDKQDIVLNGIDDAVVADPNSQARPTAKRSRSRGTGILSEERNSSLDATSDGRVELLESPDSGRAQLDAVRHVQPRSALA
jgi:hypothetical protein